MCTGYVLPSALMTRVSDDPGWLSATPATARAHAPSNASSVDLDELFRVVYTISFSIVSDVILPALVRASSAHRTTLAPSAPTASAASDARSSSITSFADTPFPARNSVMSFKHFVSIDFASAGAMGSVPTVAAETNFPPSPSPSRTSIFTLWSPFTALFGDLKYGESFTRSSLNAGGTSLVASSLVVDMVILLSTNA